MSAVYAVLVGVATAVITKGVSITGKALTKALRYKMLQKASQPVVGRTAGAAKKAFQQLNKYEPRNLPKNPNDLLKRGYREKTHPDASQAGHRTFENPVTGQEIRFDKAKTGLPGHQGNDHYHYLNQNDSSKLNAYLDRNGNHCPRGSDKSHLYPEY